MRPSISRPARRSVWNTSGISAEIPTGFQRAVACTAPRKLVEFDLSAGKIYTSTDPRSRSPAPRAEAI